MSRLVDWIKHLSLLKMAALSFFLGAVSTLAMPPLFFWPLLFLTLPPLVWMLDEINKECGQNKNSKLFNTKAGVIGWSFGFGYFIIALYWIGFSFLVEADKFVFLLPFAVTLLPATLGAFWGLAFMLTRIYWPNSNRRFVTFAVALGLAELARGHLFTGFPWHLIGLSLTGSAEMMQSLTLFGAYGLNFVAILIFVSASDLIAGRETARQANLIPPIIAGIILCLIIGFGHWRISNAGETTYVKNLTLHLIQPNIAQSEKINPQLREKALSKTIALTRTATDKILSDQKLDAHHLIILPETAIPYAVAKAPKILETLGELLPNNTSMITGGFGVSPLGESGTRKIYNSLFLINSSGEATSIYHKNHLVPFGEYLPFAPLLSKIGLEALVRLRGGFSSGKTRVPLASKTIPPVIPYICYEAIFPQSPNPHAKWQLNISNDAWFGNTAGPYQHLHHIRVRSVETGLPLVRVVNGGISAVYDGLGREVITSKLNQKIYVSSRLPNTYLLPMREKFRYLLVLLVVVLFSTCNYLTKCFDRIK